MPLYQTSLERITDHEFTPDSLEAIAPFLSSAFKRMPPPAIGPTVFKEFWDVVRPRVTLPSSRLPEDFKQALRINHDFFGGHLPSDMSYDSQSQSQFESQAEVCKRLVPTPQNTLTKLPQSIIPETPSSQLMYEPLPLLPSAFPSRFMNNGSAHRREEIASSQRDNPDLPYFPSHSEQQALVSTSGRSCSLYHGHALSEDYPWDERTPTRPTEASSSQDTPLAAVVYGPQSEGKVDEDTPTAHFRSATIPRASSAALSPEVPFLHRQQSPGPSPSYPLSRRANSMPSPSRQEATSSAPIPSSPLDRKRTRPVTSNDAPLQAQSSRPSKKRKVTIDESIKGVSSHARTSDTGRHISSEPRSRSRNVQQPDSRRGSSRKKWVFDGVLVPPLPDRQLWDAVSDMVPPSPVSSLPPSSPVPEQSQQEAYPLSDDYDDWEATVDPADVVRLQQRGGPSFSRS